MSMNVYAGSTTIDDLFVRKRGDEYTPATNIIA